MATSAGDLQQLRTLLLKAASGLELVEKKMFGCAALFTRGSIFALVWKHGRIGVKLPDAEAYDTLAKREGSEPWQPGPQMTHWLLVPAAYHGSPDDLSEWVRRAHALAQERRDAPQPAAKKPPKKPTRSVPPPASKKTASRTKAEAKPAAKKRAAKA